jgi:hypothetical protein
LGKSVTSNAPPTHSFLHLCRVTIGLRVDITKFVIIVLVITIITFLALVFLFFRFSTSHKIPQNTLFLLIQIKIFHALLALSKGLSRVITVVDLDGLAEAVDFGEAFDAVSALVPVVFVGTTEIDGMYFAHSVVVEITILTNFACVSIFKSRFAKRLMEFFFT